MEDVKVSVLDPKAIKVRGGKCSSVKRGRIFAIALASHSYKVGVFPDAPIANISGGLRLSFLIEEDDGVEVGLSSIILYPSLTRVVWVLEVASKRGGEANRFGRRGGSGDRGIVLGETNGLVGVDAIFSHVGVNEVDDTGNKKEVLYRAEVAVSGFEGFVVESIIA